MRNLIQRFKEHQTLIENFGYLSVLQGFNVLFPLLTYPYLIRALTPEAYGKVVFAQALTFVYTILINFGFRASAPRDIAEHRDENSELSEIVSNILTAKAYLWLVAVAVLALSLYFVPALAQDRWLYIYAFGTTATVLFFPDWYFQGIERMKYITFIGFGARVLTLGAILAFIHQPDDYRRLALINSGGALVGALLGIGVVYRHGVRFSWRPWRGVKEQIARSAPLFYSNLFASLSDRGGALVIGGMLGPVQLAYYDLAEKLVNLASNVFYNIGRALYPNLAKSRDKEFSRQVFRWVLIAAVLGTAALFLAAPLIIPILAGEAMLPAIPVLQLLSPYLILAATGPLLLNILLIENRHASAFPNAVLSGSSYIGMIVFIVWMGMLSPTSVAIVSVLAVVVRNFHRYYLIRRYGLGSWLRRSS